ncbi:MAG: alkyl hydroperoxide reductase subunit C [Candidatus Magasanikiibacteriota bacterium]
MPLVGKQLPDLTLKAFAVGNFSSISLKEMQGKWLILFFYPADFTFVCPTELVEMAQMYEQFKAEGVEVMSVSTDTEFVHKAWHDNSPSIKQINFPMLADPTGELSRAVGVYIAEEGLALRGTFIIDPEGRIKAYEVHDNSIGRNAQELLRKLQAAKFVREHNGEVCPASWKPGAMTLKPGVELVGKI